jgi:hypothetical protein
VAEQLLASQVSLWFMESIPLNVSGEWFAKVSVFLFMIFVYSPKQISSMDTDQKLLHPI